MASNMNTCYLFNALLLLCAGGVKAFFPQQQPLFGPPAARPLGVAPTQSVVGGQRPVAARGFQQNTLPVQPGTSSTSQIQVNGGCGSASGRSTSQGTSVQSGFQFCGVAPAGRSLRDAILNGDITTAARTLVQSLDRNGLIAGLTAPDGFQLRKSPISRDKDPDVTAVKGIAQAALTDSGQIAKYVDVILKAALPKDLHKFDANTQKLVSIGECSLSLSATSTGQNVQVSKDKNCRQALVKPFELQQHLINTLSNRGQMQLVLNADPDTWIMYSSMYMVLVVGS